jgi:hypothetical protein
MFVGSELAGQRAAVVMILAQSAKLNGRDPFSYLSYVVRRLNRAIAACYETGETNDEIKLPRA